MRRIYDCLSRRILWSVLPAVLLAGMPAQGGAAENSPKTVINHKTYLWLLPRFRMGGDESYAVFQIENPFDREITFYMHCRSAAGTIGGMTGRHRLRPRQVKIVDSRRHRAGPAGDGTVLVNCSIKSHSRATVRTLIRDNRRRHFGDEPAVIQPRIG